MTSDLDFVLEDCLERLAQGETLQACLARYPEQAAELRPLLQAAVQLEGQAQVRPSAAFKTRTRTQLYAHMQAHPRPNRWQWSLSLPVFRLAGSLAALLLVFTLTGTALAQSALPGDDFYPWKLASEQVWRAVSPDPIGFDLSLAERRVDEVMAVPGNATAQEAAVKGYQRAVTDLEKYQDPSVQARIQQALEAQQERLQSAGLLPVDQKAPSPTTTVSPTPIPVSTQKLPVLPTSIPVSTQKLPPLPKPTSLPSILAPTVLIPTALRTIIQIPSAIPTKVKIPTIIQIPTIKLPGLP